MQLQHALPQIQKDKDEAFRTKCEGFHTAARNYTDMTRRELEHERTVWTAKYETLQNEYDKIASAFAKKQSLSDTKNEDLCKVFRSQLILAQEDLQAVKKTEGDIASQRR